VVNKILQNKVEMSEQVCAENLNNVQYIGQDFRELILLARGLQNRANLTKRCYRKKTVEKFV
jgi:hypothetical protein